MYIVESYLCMREENVSLRSKKIRYARERKYDVKLAGNTKEGFVRQFALTPPSPSDGETSTHK